jgi:hypothetical protein
MRLWSHDKVITQFSSKSDLTQYVNASSWPRDNFIARRGWALTKCDLTEWDLQKVKFKKFTVGCLVSDELKDF